jgi:chemotaxis protein histidine kinase CheA/ActR/RegA family two-component response regulator
MNISDLLALLREEFAIDVPMAQEAVHQAAMHPDQSSVLLEPVIGFIDRSFRASALVNLNGLGAYFARIAEFARSQAVNPNAASLEWLSRWTEPAQAYLEAPAQTDSAQGIIDFLKSCPLQTDDTALGMLLEQLLRPPTLNAEDEQSAQALVEEATLADVSLVTEDVDAALLSAMLQDAPDQLDQLSATLDALSRGTIDLGKLAEAQRIAHTFKGSGNIIGLPGIGRLAHRLEDVLEWVLAQAQTRTELNGSAVRDMQHAVVILQQMVAYLLGEESAPGGALACLQRLIDWVNWIRQDVATSQSPDPLSTVEVSEAPQTDTQTPRLVSETTGDTQTLRVGVDRLSRVLRRATQSIVASQRVGQLVRTVGDRLDTIEANHIELSRRLRELEQTVDKQVVQLRERKESGELLDPLEMDRYDSLHILSRFVAEAVQDEVELARQAREHITAAQMFIRNEDQQLREQHRDLLGARLVPVKSILPRLKRNVAQTAASTGKRARLVVEGENTTVDADVLTRLTEPLLHLLRNAVDHGLETPDERRWLGKEDEGTILLGFRRVGQDVELTCSDNGKGLDLPTIYDKAVEYGLISRGTSLTDDEVQSLILRPGFSTKGEVTEVSGRGVGMDVVNDRIAGLKGKLKIQSQVGQGTRFTIRVPVSSGAVQALVARCADVEIALPSDQVILALSADERQTEQSEGQTARLIHHGQSYPLYPLGVWLGFEDASESSVVGKPAVLCHGSNGTIALAVDAVVDARELILQDIGRMTRRIPGVVAGSLRNDGLPMFLLDVTALERAATRTKVISSSLAMRRRLALQRTRVLVVDDALSVRRSMQQLLEDAGYEVIMAADGFQALDAVRALSPAIVLTDLEMPNLNGLELTKRLRELPQFMGTPIVMITSRASDKHRDMALGAGVDLYLTKPYTDAVLMGHIKRLTAQDAAALML